MKQKHYIGFIALVLATLLAGCVHDYPTLTPDGEEGVDPTLVVVNTEVTLDLELVPLEIITQKNARPGITKAAARADNNADNTDYRRRFIIEARRNGKPEARQVTVMKDAEDGDKKLTLPINLKLHAVEYTLVVWTDYVAAGTETDLYYNTEDLQQIACTDPYTGSTDYRDCLYGTASLDLRPYRDQWNASVQAKVDMVRPLAKYEIIATDVDYFLAKTKKQRATGGPFTITCSYSYFFPTVFDALSGKPCDWWPDVSFTTPLTVPDDGTQECTVATDYIFVNGSESSVVLSIEIHDSEGNILSRIQDIQIPYQRGHITTLRGHFLTSGMEGGIVIDPDYDGDIEVDLDNLLQ